MIIISVVLLLIAFIRIHLGYYSNLSHYCQPIVSVIISGDFNTVITDAYNIYQACYHGPSLLATMKYRRPELYANFMKKYKVSFEQDYISD